MCWTTTKRVQEQVSDGKVKVTKICRLDNNRNIIGGYYYDFNYQLKTEYQTKIQMESNIYDPNSCRGFRGFHSYLQNKVEIQATETHAISVYAIVQGEKGQEKILLDKYQNRFLTNDICVVNGYLPK